MWRGRCREGVLRKSAEMYQWLQNHFFIFPIALVHFYKVISEYYHHIPGVESVETISLTLHVHVTH